MGLFLRVGPLVVAGAICGCRAPPALREIPVDVSLSVSAETVAVGDTVTLHGMAANGGSAPVTAGAGCAPGIGFFVTNEAGERRDLFADAVFTCDVKDSNSIEPGETDSVDYVWIPTAAGSYELTAVLLLTATERLTSPAVVVTVTAGPPAEDSVASPTRR